MPSTKPLVVLTGVNGYVGAAVLRQLLQSNYRVRGIARSLQKTEYLKNKYPDATASGDLTFQAVADIQAPHAMDSAIADAEYLAHVASPFFLKADDPVKELIDPAVNGTENVMSSAIAAKNLKKVVVVSSFASVIDLSKNPRAGYVYTEKDWNPLTREEGSKSASLAYYASKALAEKKAWDMWQEAKSRKQITWDLITLCPPMVYGPPEQEVDLSKGVDGLGESLQQFMRNVQGENPEFAPKVATPGLPAWVDVRDLALGHVKAFRLEPGVSERFLMCGGTHYYEDGLAEWRGRGDKLLGEEGDHIDRSKHFSLDTTKARTVLGMEFTPFEKTVTDTIDSVVSRGIIKQ
jgi:nucleoside-diphosphate-sugar epimerase